MEKIEIRIPDNLTPSQEAVAILKKYTKLIGKEQKKIGAGFDLKHTKSQITIIRETKEKIHKTKECPVCKSVFPVKNASSAYTNYGGMSRKILFCGNECADTACTASPRITRKRISHAWLIR